ncbi:MAG TPA: hypothetical protein VH370_16080 [Humisphaera sp.]|jgi:hypothetical protein|nr:hypothetical protein [Humisphaera sp.]
MIHVHNPYQFVVGLLAWVGGFSPWFFAAMVRHWRYMNAHGNTIHVRGEIDPQLAMCIAGTVMVVSNISGWLLVRHVHGMYVADFGASAWRALFICCYSLGLAAGAWIFLSTSAMFSLII